MKKLLSFFLSPLKVLGRATLITNDASTMLTAKEGPPIVLLGAMLLVYELVPCRSGA